VRVCVFIVSCDAHTIDLSSCISVTQSHDICPPCEQSVFFSHHAALCCGIHISCVVACTYPVLWHAHFLHISCTFLAHFLCCGMHISCTFLVLWHAHFLMWRAHFLCCGVHISFLPSCSVVLWHALFVPPYKHALPCFVSITLSFML
jgi:hypothetical protein